MYHNPQLTHTNTSTLPPGFLGALASGGGRVGGGARGFLRRLLGRWDGSGQKKGLPASSSADDGGTMVSPQLPWRAHPRPKLGDPAQLSTLGGCLRALDHHVRAEDAPAVFEALCEKEGHRIAAFMVEPIQGEAGVVVPQEQYLANIKAICQKHRILLICDEVQTGLGRCAVLGNAMQCYAMLSWCEARRSEG